MNARIGGLCFGYGGLDLAVQSVIPDAELAWYAEFDKGASKIGAHRFPGVPNHGDMTAIDWSAVEPVDILTGGTPCQDLSGRVLGDLASLGFDAEWRGLRAADVGAPHGRLRVFVVAWPAADTERLGGSEGRRDASFRPAGSGASGLPDLGRARGAVLPTPTTRDWKGHNQRGDTSCLTGALLPSPRTSDTNGAGLHGDGGMDLRTAVTLLPTPAVNDMGKAYTPETWDAWCAEQQSKHGNGNGHGKSLEIEAQRLLPTPVVTDATGTRNRTAGRSEDAKPFAVGTTLGDVAYEASWGDYGPAVARWEHLTRTAPAPTETGPKGSPRLSARFSEWMMGLPDGWVTDVPGITRNEALKALGNGVVPQQAAVAIADALTVAEVAA